MNTLRTTQWLVLAGFILLFSCSQSKNETRDLQLVEKVEKPYTAKNLSKADRIDLAFKQEFDKTRDPRTLTIPRERLINGRQIIQGRKNARIQAKATSLTWEERGPYNVGGRTKAILWDPQIADKVWAGAASGGLWYNTDITNASSEWTAVDDLMENLSVTAIAYDPTDPDVMYIGTGEGHIIGSVKGAGMLKSTDAGATWTHMTIGNGFFDTESNFHYVNDILVKNESGTGVIYVGTQESVNEYTYYGNSYSGENGLWRSTDGGVTFTQQLPTVPSETVPYSVADLELDANGRIWAGTADDLFSRFTSTIFYSDNGTTWTEAESDASGNRVELAVSPSDPSIIYAVASNGSNNVGWMKKNTDATNDPTGTWSSITIPSHSDPTNGAVSCGSLTCATSGADFTRGQAFYDLIMKVDPSDADRVWIGGIDLHLSTNGGSSWTAKTSWVDVSGFGCSCLPYIHADQHVLEFNPNDDTELLSGNDGGVFLSSDADATTPSWGVRNNNYNVTQFYGGAIHPTAGTNQFLAGAQDNGSQYFNGTGMITTSEASGGDGAYCNIDQDEPEYQWTQYVYNSYYRSTNTGASFSYVGEFQSGGVSVGRFINPSIYDDTENIMYAAGDTDEFLRWTNPQIGGSGGFISADFDGGQVSCLTVSPNTSNRVFFGTGTPGINSGAGGKIYYIDGANSGASETPVDISDGSFPTNSYLSSIAVGELSDDHIVVTFSNYGVSSVWETTDLGSTWTEIEGNLPDMPVRWAVIHPEDANRIILATELGVWSTDATSGGTTDWEPHDDESFPHVRTDMLKVRASDLEMIAITHGRGLWSTNIALPTTTDPEISFSTSTSSQTETTVGTDGCRNYRDYTVSMEIANPPTGDATVTLAVEGSTTGTEGYDFDFTTTDFNTPSSDLTFSDGSTTNQSFTLRIYNDDAVESSETVVFDYTISGTTTAIAGSANQTFTFTINDDDLAPTVDSFITLLSEDFESQSSYADLTTAGWGQYTFDGGAGTTNQWRFGTQRVLSGSNSLYVSRGNSNSNYNVNSSSNRLMVTPILDGTGLSSIDLEFNYQCNGEAGYDYGSLYYAIDTNDDGSVLDETFNQFVTNLQGITSTTLYQTTLPAALNGEKFVIGFHWLNDGSLGAQPAFVIDDIEISAGVTGTTIASTQSQTHSTNFGPNETIYFYDDSSGDILLSLENLSSWDYGCTDVTIDQAGTGAMTMNGQSADAYPASKIISITPTTNNATGSYTITMYYTEAEIDGWIAASGNGTVDLEMIKVDGPFNADVASAGSSDWEASTPTIGTFGSDYTFASTFNTGFSTFGVGNTASWSAPLPVEWTYFRAKNTGKGVSLEWQTASEKNADKFIVEHSTDGENFISTGDVKAAGESTVLLDYEFIHPNPQKGVNYYRLKQMDLDGQFEYSEVKSVTIRPMNFAVAEIFPNPATDLLHVNFSSEVEKTRIELLSIEGKTVLSMVSMGAGSGLSEDLNVSNLKRGIYFVRVSDGFDSVVRKVVLR